MKEQELNWEEWKTALRTPPPHKNKKKYNRKSKHKNQERHG
jgi:hypothetical protein